jgi:glycine cleavage system regulatory protein
MRSSMVLTVIGPDRPGIVELVAATVAAHGGNWEQSRMAHLCGQFAGILHISLPTARVAELHAALCALADRELRVVCQIAKQSEPQPSRGLQLEVTGNDREGIVRDISRALATRGVNVEQLDTSHESAPMTGSALFHAQAVLRLPPNLDLGELRATLESIADDLMIDLALVPLEQTELSHAGLTR